MVVDPCFRDAYKLKSMDPGYQGMLDSRKRKRARLTTVKHLVSSQARKGYMREDEYGEFYFLKGGTESAPCVRVDSKVDDVA